MLSGKESADLPSQMDQCPFYQPITWDSRQALLTCLKRLFPGVDETISLYCILLFFNSLANSFCISKIFQPSPVDLAINSRSEDLI